MKLHFCFVLSVGRKKVPESLRNYTVCDSDEERGCFQGLVKPAPWQTRSDDPIVEIAHLVKKQRLAAALWLSSSSSPFLPIQASLFTGRDIHH